jgi:hypothetical protein
MAATREQIMQALLAKLQASGEFATVSRRNRNPETIAAPNTPALILVGDSESYEGDTPSLPQKRRLHVDAIIYYDVGDDENAIPDSVINPLLDGIDAALAPDKPATNSCTLGDLVQSVRIIGKMIKAPGDKTGKGLAIVPIVILIP